MPSTPTPACLVCHKHRGEFAVPGGAIFENDLNTEGMEHVYAFVLGDGVPEGRGARDSAGGRAPAGFFCESYANDR